MRWIGKSLRALVPDTWRQTIAIALIGGFAVYAYWAISLDQNTGTVHSSRIETPVVRAGESFQISYSITWDRRCTVTGYRFIVDGAGFRHDRVIDTREVSPRSDDSRDNFSIKITVPSGATPGPATYHGQIRYACNWLQGQNEFGWGFPFTRTLSPREFTILPPMSTTDIGMPLSVAQCPLERPVFVKAHCRSSPSSNTLAGIGDGIDIVWAQ